MNIVIFGATGGTGRHLVDQALDAGHNVTVCVRYPNRVHRAHERLRIVSGHVQHRQPVLEAIEGQDAVLSTVGQVRKRPSVAHLLTVGATNIIEAMEFHNVHRLIFLTGAGVTDPNDRQSLATRLTSPLRRLFSGHVLEDAEDAVELIKLSSLDWTIVRVAKLNDQPPVGNLSAGYRQSRTSPVSRADCAAFILAQLENERYLRQAPFIYYEGTD